VPRDPGDLYQVSPQAPELESDLVMLHYLDGFVDAGGAGRLVASHLLGTIEHTEVARFDIDSLIDYRSRRPPMIFARDHWESVEAPELVLHLLHDADGRPFLLLDGPEPDRDWEAFTAAVIRLCTDLGVRLAAGFHGIPMGVPHTRPLGLTSHATRTELVGDAHPLADRLQVPGSASALLELRMGEAGRDALGFAVHVPHYLAHATYPSAAVTLLGALSLATGLNLPDQALREAAELTDAEIARQVSGSEEVAEVVRSLEAQYDAFHSEHQDLLAASGETMPSGEELAEQFERFLAEQQNGGEAGPAEG
jgi:hypothetical protein